MTAENPESHFDVVEWSRSVKRQLSEEMATGTFRAPSLEELSSQLGIPLRSGSSNRRRHCATPAVGQEK